MMQLLLQQGWVRWNPLRVIYVIIQQEERCNPSGRVSGWITLWRKRCRWSEGLSWEPPMTASPAARSLWSTPEGCDLQLRPPKNLPSGTADTILPTPLELRRQALSPKLWRCRWDTRRRRSIGRQCYVWLAHSDAMSSYYFASKCITGWLALDAQLETKNLWSMNVWSGCDEWCEGFDALELLCGVFDLYTLPDCQLLVSPSRSIHGSSSSISIRDAAIATCEQTTEAELPREFN